MFENLFSSWLFYAVAAIAVGTIVYGVWTGLKESNETYRRVYGRLSELFETEPQSYVIRSLSKADSSKVGSVEIGEDSVMTVVLSGPGGIFIDNKARDGFFSIPWERIEVVDQLSEKRVSLRVDDPAGRSTEIVIPWSNNMTLEGWTRYNEQNE